MNNNKLTIVCQPTTQNTFYVCLLDIIYDIKYNICLLNKWLSSAFDKKLMIFFF